MKPTVKNLRAVAVLNAEPERVPVPAGECPF